MSDLNKLKKPVHTAELIVEFFMRMAQRLKLGSEKYGDDDWTRMQQALLAELIAADVRVLQTFADIHSARWYAEDYKREAERAKELCCDIANRAAMLWGQLNDLHKGDASDASTKTSK